MRSALKPTATPWFVLVIFTSLTALVVMGYWVLRPAAELDVPAALITALGVTVAVFAALMAFTQVDEDRCMQAEFARTLAALDNTANPIVIGDENGMAVYVNASARVLLGENNGGQIIDIPGPHSDVPPDRDLNDLLQQFGVRREQLADLNSGGRVDVVLGDDCFRITSNTPRSKSGEPQGTVLEFSKLAGTRHHLPEPENDPILDALGSLRLSVDAEGIVVDFNPGVLDFLGYEREQLLGMSLEDIAVDGMSSQTIRQLTVNGVLPEMRTVLKCADRTLAPVNLFGLLASRDEAWSTGNPLLILAKSVLHSKGVDSEFLFSRDLADRFYHGIALVDSDWNMLSIDRAFSDITSTDLDGFLGRHLGDFLPQSDSWSGVLGGDVWEGECHGERADGREYVLLTTVHGLGEDGVAGNRLVTIKDVTRVKESERRAWELAYKDTLTGLANRADFEIRVTETVKRCRRTEERFAILYFDLDGFKYINDSLGHAAGDQLLRTIAQRLENAVRETDFAARLGGDEFCILAEDIKYEHEVAKIAEKCLAAIAEPMEIDTRKIRPQASVGVAIFPDDGDDREILLQAADSAMYAAKEAGKHRFAFYSSEMTEAAQKRLALEQQLRVAMENGDFELMFQPQIDLKSGRMVGVESLIRWRHPTRGIVQPDEFIDAAEKMGLIEELDVWVLKAACKQAIVWAEAGVDDLLIAVNMCASHFEGGGIVDVVEQTLFETGLNPDCLELEVTETVVQTNVEAIDTFDRLKQLGVKIAIDDFGTGYSCLDSIRRLPVNRLKIDRVFVRDLPSDSENSSIIATIIAMGRAMGLSVVAEGVEHLEQVQYLSGLGCELVQGYYFSRPVASSEIVQLAGRSFLPSRHNVARKIH